MVDTKELIKEINTNSEKLKVFANTNSKGVTTYSWEVQVLGSSDRNMITTEDQIKLKKLNDWCITEYGNKNSISL